MTTPLEASIKLPPVQPPKEEPLNESERRNMQTFVLAHPKPRTVIALEESQHNFFSAKSRSHFGVGTKTVASIVDVGPRFIVVEAFGVKRSIGAGTLSTYEYPARKGVVPRWGQTPRCKFRFSDCSREKVCTHMPEPQSRG